MRSRLVVIALAVVLVHGCGPQDSDLRRERNSAGANGESVWVYDETSQFHGVMPLAVQQMRHPDPVAVATAVCMSLGGRLDFMQRPSAGRERLGFNCAFAEPNLTMTAEFGELRRIRSTG